LPTIVPVAFVHFVEFYRSGDVFSRYRFCRFKVSHVFYRYRRTHKKSPAHSSV